MKALSIRQPWAWLIAAGHKLIENRTWRTAYRGPLLIHASTYFDFLYDWRARTHAQKPAYGSICVPHTDKLKRGGVIAIAQLVDITTTSADPWFEGPYGWILANVQRVPFLPLRGFPGLFEGPNLAFPSAQSVKSAVSLPSEGA